MSSSQNEGAGVAFDQPGQRPEGLGRAAQFEGGNEAATRARHAAIGALTPPTAPPGERPWTTYRPVPLPDADEARWVESHLRPLAGLGGQERAGDQVGEAGAAWRRFFEALAEQRPLVLVFEDLHWADDGLLDFIDHLAEWTSDIPLLLLCTVRPELLDRRPGWGGGKRNATTISLAPLSEEETEMLVASLLENGRLREERRGELLARAGGNPLYAEEYVRMLSQAEEELPLPKSVQGIIAARLDTLAAGEKALVQGAAVVGKVFWPAALAEALGTERGTVEQGLRALERREFVRRERRSSVAGETAYVFRHVLVRDVAYGQIPRGRRAEFHRRVAEWIEALAGDRLEDLADMVAHHYSTALNLARSAGLAEGELAVRARKALREAADRSFALNEELNLVIYDSGVARRLEQVFDKLRQRAHQPVLQRTARVDLGFVGGDKLEKPGIFSTPPKRILG